MEELTLMTFEVKPLSNVMGARIIGLDLSQSLSGSTKSTLKSAFLDYHLLCFETPPLSAANFLEFSKEFGAPQLQLLENLRDNDFPEVSILNSTYKTPEAKPKNLAEVRLSGWHTDDSYFEKPAKATLLQALHIPDKGGQTRFINTRLAYEEMPEAVKSNIANLEATHCYDTVRASAKAQELTVEEHKKTNDIVHPLIRTHEDTGNRAIYFNPNRTDQVVGKSRKESDAILDILYAWLIKEDFQYEHEWRRGDLLMWDNRCLLHSVNVDFPVGQRREHQRILLKGTRPF